MTTILTFVVIILGVLALVQLIRVFELTSVLRGKAPELPTDSENKFQARMMIPLLIGYMAFFLWLTLEYGGELLPIAASAHGGDLDDLLNFNFILITVIFVVTHILLFYFAYKYVYNKEKKAYYFAHSNKLELIWTLVPALFLAIIIVYGLANWNEIMDESDVPDDAVLIELYSKQFDWTARYAGADSTLGRANYNMISGTNPLGLITTATIKGKIAELQSEIDTLTMRDLPKLPEGGKLQKEMRKRIAGLERQKGKVMEYQAELKANGAKAGFGDGDDDIVVKGEFHIPKGKTVNFVFRSQDVIHSAYMPHFRAQMNTVPGMVTTFHFEPIFTTEEMREETGNPDFNYLLLCNKICGAAHYNMQMNIVVDEEEDYQAWLAEQKNFSTVYSGGDEAEESKEEKTAVAQAE